jgi:hypothetical protein
MVMTRMNDDADDQAELFGGKRSMVPKKSRQQRRVGSGNVILLNKNDWGGNISAWAAHHQYRQCKRGTSSARHVIT